MRSRDPRFSPPLPEIERRVQSLIDALTLPEKILLLGGKPGAGSTCRSAPRPPRAALGGWPHGRALVVTPRRRIPR